MKSILNVLLFSFLFVSIFSTVVLADYRMELWVKKPDTTTTKVNECTSTVANFTCSYNYYDTSQVGTYQGNAITYQDTTFLSQSDWVNLYTVTTPPTSTSIPNDKPFFAGGSFNITAYIEYLNIFWYASYPTAQRVLAVNCTFYGKSIQICTPYPYIQPPGQGSCTVINPDYDYTKENKVTCRVYDPNNPSVGYNEY
jgi:hypothetical protein